jgi:1-acyl-sn-glycerol-3-phosphate acyltransferase
MKKFWFFFPLKYWLNSLGGIAVAPKGTGGALTDQVIADFKKRDYMNLAITPEGTRSATKTWRHGFLYIALGAGVPIQLGVLDYRHKRIEIKEEFTPTGEIDADMQRVKDFYAKHKEDARYPSQFDC